MSDGSRGIYFEDQDGNRIYPKGAHLGNLDTGDTPSELVNPKDGTVYDLSNIGGGSSTDTRIDIEDGTGTVVVSDAEAAAFAAGAYTSVQAADDGDGTVTITSSFDEIAYLVDHPERTGALNILASEAFDITVPVPDGETLEVYRWGVWKIADFTAPTGLEVQLLDGGDTVQASANTTDQQSTSSTVASFTNSSGSTSLFKLRVSNGTGSDLNVDGVGGHFGYRVVA